MKLNGAIEKSGRSVSWLAKAAKIPYHTLYNVASGRRRCSVRVASKVAHLLGCEVILVRGELEFAKRKETRHG